MAIASPLPRRVPVAPDDDRKHIARWLFVVCGMIVAMVLIGAITRLTESGLSIMEWAPVTGFLPPMSDAEWQRLFALYQQTPEYQQINAGMDVAAFKTIFWWEWVHRFWGRLIGLIYLVPLVVFLARRRIPAGLTKHLIFGFILGGAQGALGWFMVASGLGDRTDVSQYRLAAHLALALAIYLYLLWLAIGCVRAPASRVWPGLKPQLILLFMLIALTVTMGAFTAGLDAGFIYNEFPTMGGAFVPGEAFALEPAWRNIFENPVTAQLVHRWLAIGTAAAILFVCWRAPRGTETLSRKRPVDLLAAMALVQVALGIVTLLSVVWLPLAVLHQAGAVALLSFALWAIYEARPIPGIGRTK